MCGGFGAIVNKNLDICFSGPNWDGNCSHQEIIRRMGWAENQDRHIRNFVRVQFSDWTEASFEFDEEETLPGWAEDNRQEIMEKSIKLLGLCAAAWEEYDKVRAATLEEYENVCAAAWAEYDKVLAPAWALMIGKLSTIRGYVMPDGNLNQEKAGK